MSEVSPSGSISSLFGFGSNSRHIARCMQILRTTRSCMLSVKSTSVHLKSPEAFFHSVSQSMHIVKKLQT